MLPATHDWLDGLRAFAAAHRVEKPLTATGSPAQQAAERMILAAQLSTWLDGSEAMLNARAARLPSEAGADPDPAIVITTSPVGIAVAEEQLARGSLPARALAGRATAVTELEYRLWCIRHPDDGHARHINIWNWIKTSVPRQRDAEFARHPLAEGEAYWLHRAGIAGAATADRRDCHLWKWNGRQASLLEAFVAERGVSELT
ncbi:MAG: hypothetical protein ACKOCX_05015 [Planctomycetota bacterium]